MADGVLLDTSFLISLADPSRPHHAVAVQYFRHFGQEGIPMFLSTIVASEFHLGQPVSDLPLDTIIVLPFNLDDAMHAAELNFTLFKGDPGTSRDALKDDFKLLGQAKARDIACILTEDAKTLYRYCAELKAAHKLTTKAVKLVDGFDKSHFEPGGQYDFDISLDADGPDESVSHPN